MRQLDHTQVLSLSLLDVKTPLSMHHMKAVASHCQSRFKQSRCRHSFHFLYILLPTSPFKPSCPFFNTSSIPSSISETQETCKPSCLYPSHRILHCWDFILQSLRFQTCCHSNLIWCNLSRSVLQISGGEMELGYVDSSNLPPPKVPKA